jgi:hypothetical protein
LELKGKEEKQKFGLAKLEFEKRNEEMKNGAYNL